MESMGNSEGYGQVFLLSEWWPYYRRRSNRGPLVYVGGSYEIPVKTLQGLWAQKMTGEVMLRVSTEQGAQVLKTTSLI